MNISKRDQNLLLGLVIIIAVFVFVRFIYMPGREEIQTLKADRQELQQEKQQLEKVVPKTAAESKKTEQELADLAQRLPSEDEMVPLLTVLEKNCEKYKVIMTLIEYKRTAPKDGEADQSGAEPLVFTIGVKGKVSQLFDYLNQMENEQRLVSIQNVAMDAVKKELITVSDENEPPAYYIAPPGMPEAKLQRVTFEVEDAEPITIGEQPVAASLVPDTFVMKITFDAYYADISNEQDQAETDKSSSQENNKDARGEV